MNGFEKYTDVKLQYDLDRTISPLLFGDNLEHTRGCINGGLSAEILRNRKFVGKPGRFGLAHEWYPIGEKTVFSFGESYTRHGEGYKMNRCHEMNAQFITNYFDEKGGIGQKDLYFKENTDYIFTLAVKSLRQTQIGIAIKSHSGEIYDAKCVYADPGDYQEKSVILKSGREDFEGKVEITFDGAGTVMLGAVSMMPGTISAGCAKTSLKR